VAFFDVSRPPRYGRWLALVLVVLVALAMAGCSKAEAQEPQPTAKDIKRAAAGKWLCPGMHAEWISNTEAQCLKER
jgi:nitrous oxide reductase accessory protein NosL